jgi:RNA polymerase-binding transcription factor DksA
MIKDNKQNIQTQYIRKNCIKHDWQETENYFICKICGEQIEKERMLPWRRPRSFFEDLGFNSTIG